ncbi:MAG: hypothetical protein ACTSU7_08855 [Candidatus Heimdallarchaeaceae archaeon]
MTYSYSELLDYTHKMDEIDTKSIYSNLYFVASLFDEKSGPIVIYNNSPLDNFSLEKLNLRVFSFLMQGSEFGPDNFAKLRGIVHIPQTDYYTSAIDISVKKKDSNSLTDIYVPLLIYLIFPKEDIAIYAKIANELEQFISRYWERGITSLPDIREVELLIKKLQKRIDSIQK